MEDPDLLRAMVSKKRDLPEANIEELIKADLPKGYLHLSRKAVEQLLPHLENGDDEFTSIQKVYPDRADQTFDFHELLPMPPDVRNPIVQRALVEVRKVVNAIIRKYGRPDRIRVELARDMKGSQEQRKQKSLDMWKRNQENEQTRKMLREEHNIAYPSRDDIVKYHLWVEQEGICAYTTKPIPLNRLFSPDIEVDHVMPYSRSLDDSFINKVVCFTRANRDKGNQTPAEWMEGNPDKLERMYQAYSSFEKIPYFKKRNFKKKTVELDNCISRQLNDTRYISTEVIRYLQCLFEPELQKKRKVVQATRGQLTAELRHHWGLNSILNPLSPDLKNREDHRHHAVDAVVIALSSNGHMQKLARAYKRYQENERLSLPWEGFRGDVAEVINKINVSFRVKRKVSGALHEETSYGHIEGDRFVYRVALSNLSGAMVKDVRDPVIRELVLKRCLEHGVDPDKVGSKKLPGIVFPADQPLCMKSGVQIKKVRIETILGKNRIGICDEAGKPFRYAKLGSNHHIEILRTKDAKGNDKYTGEVITTLEAARRIREKQPIIRRDHGPDAQFVMSLSINEGVMVKLEDGKHHLFRVQKMSSTGEIVFRPHTFAGQLSDRHGWPLILRKMTNSLMQMDAFKVNLSPLGEVSVAHD